MKRGTLKNLHVMCFCVKILVASIASRYVPIKIKLTDSQGEFRRTIKISASLKFVLCRSLNVNVKLKACLKSKYSHHQSSGQ